MIAEIRNKKGELDFRAMASELMAQRNCKWSEACLEIKHRYPEARKFFHAPPVFDK